MMRDLSVSALIFCLVELLAFTLLWHHSQSFIILACLVHLLNAGLAAQWFSMRWSNQTINAKHVWLYVCITVTLLPVVGCMILAIIDNKQALREYGIRADLGTEHVKKHSAKELLNYFSAPDFHQKGNIRKTRDLLSSLDDEAYLGLLIASRHLPDKEAYALLSEALLSPFESARLMAYSLKGKLEEQMQNDLQNKLDALEAAQEARRAELHLAVAHDYLHLLNVGVESSSKAVLLQHASDHCIASIREDKSSSGAAFRTLSEILEHQGKVLAAQKARMRAISLGIPEKEMPLSSALTA